MLPCIPQRHSYNSVIFLGVITRLHHRHLFRQCGQSYRLRWFTRRQNQQTFNIIPDKNAETDIAGMQKQYDFVTDVNKTVDKAHQSIKNIRKINTQLGAFQKQYKENESVKDLVEKAKALSEQFSEIEKAL